MNQAKSGWINDILSIFWKKKGKINVKYTLKENRYFKKNVKKALFYLKFLYWSPLMAFVLLVTPLSTRPNFFLTKD